MIERHGVADDLVVKLRRLSSILLSQSDRFDRASCGFHTRCILRATLSEPISVSLTPKDAPSGALSS